MESISALCNEIFTLAINDYHVHEMIDGPYQNPYEVRSMENLLYEKVWVDAMQWHMEDEVRDPAITAEKALYWKRRIDKQNQIRTDITEKLDDWFTAYFSEVKTKPDARLNTESIGWAIDRLSILNLKIYHMAEQAARNEAGEKHMAESAAKLAILTEQRNDLSQSINELAMEIKNGDKRMKVYRQMKMYNDEALNPVFYKK